MIPVSQIGTIADLMSEVYSRVSTAANTPAHAISLPGYTKGTNILSRLYIQDSLANEDIIIPIISTLNQLYAGYILTALQLNQYVAGSKTVKDILKLVSTEEYVDVIDVITEGFGEASYDDYVISTEATVIDLDPASQRLMSGRVIEVDLALSQGDEGKTGSRIKIVLYVQLIPYLLKPEVIGGFISLNFSPTLLRRFLQMKAGDISVRDFLFAQDLVSNYKKAMKSDRSGVLHDMLKLQNNNLSKAISGRTGTTPPNYNVANSIMIIDRKNFDRCCAKAGVNFKLSTDRVNFFKQSFMMILVVVNTTYNDIEMYFNGIDHVGQYTYNMINKLTKGGDKFDLKEIMTAFGQGGSPKF